MGRIYGGPVKRIGDELINKYPGLFNGDFDNNKEKVRAVLNVESKKLVNKVAGYITSKINASDRAKPSSEEEVEDPGPAMTQNASQEGI